MAFLIALAVVIAAALACLLCLWLVNNRKRRNFFKGSKRGARRHGRH